VRWADRAVPLTLMLTCLVACGEAVPSVRGSGLATTTPEPSTASMRAAQSPSQPASATPQIGIDLPSPGSPLNATELLAAMRASTRPGGVPDQLETESLAESLARIILTVDGSPWSTSAIGGSCGNSTCILDVAGSHAGREGEDLWTFEIALRSGAITTLVSDVRSLDAELVASLDELARGRDDQDVLADLVLTTARWLPPPAGLGFFALSYRSGGEEGSCALELVLDAGRGAMVEVTDRGC
jgi:hypothetical protein